MRIYRYVAHPRDINQTRMQYGQKCDLQKQTGSFVRPVYTEDFIF